MKKNTPYEYLKYFTLRGSQNNTLLHRQKGGLRKKTYDYS